MMTGEMVDRHQAAVDEAARIRGSVAALFRDESGQDMIEYALVAALIGLGAVVSLKGLGAKIATALGNVGTVLTTDT